MSWRAYFAAFAVHSPVHVGYHTVSHSDRTRYYIPGKNMMSAFASALDAEEGGVNTSVLQAVRESFLFSTFFVSRNGRDALFPALTEDGDLYYGRERLSLWDFTSQFISAKEGRKYQAEKTRSEMDFIVPKNNLKKDQNYLVGYIFASDDAEDKGLGAWLRSLRELNIGEEVGSRMGNVRLIVLEKVLREDNRVPFFSLDGIYLDWSQDKVTVVYEKQGPLLGYLRAEGESSFVSIYGVQESTEGSIDLLQKQSTEVKSNKCWVPGTLVKPAPEGSTFVMGYDGLLGVETKDEENT